MQLAVTSGKALVEYKDEGHTLKGKGIRGDWRRADAGRVG